MFILDTVIILLRVCVCLYEVVTEALNKYAMFIHSFSVRARAGVCVCFYIL